MVLASARHHFSAVKTKHSLLTVFPARLPVPNSCSVKSEQFEDFLKSWSCDSVELEVFE